MGAMKNALINVHQCDTCNSEGWVSFNSGDGTPDWIPCECNPYEFPKDELTEIFEEWDKEV
jgi:hypothetical protein